MYTVYMKAMVSMLALRHIVARALFLRCFFKTILIPTLDSFDGDIAFLGVVFVLRVLLSTHPANVNFAKVTCKQEISSLRN